MCWWQNTHRDQNTNRFCKSSKYHQKILPCYRILSALILFQTVICSAIQLGSKWYLVFVFFTTWGAQLTFISFAVLSCLNFKFCKHRICCKNSWAFVQITYTLALSASVPIFLIYWLALFRTLQETGFFETHSLFYQIELHVFVQAFIIIDFILSSVLIDRNHLLILIIFGVSYIILNAIVSLTMFVVYPIMTWRDWSTLIWVVAAVVLMLSSFYFFVKMSEKKQLDRTPNYVSYNQQMDEYLKVRFLQFQMQQQTRMSN